MTVSQQGSGHARPAVSQRAHRRDTPAASQTSPQADMEVAAGQCVSPTPWGHTGTRLALTPTERVPGRGSYKDPSRDVGRQVRRLPNTTQRTPGVMRGKQPESARVGGWPELVGAILRGVPSLPGALCRQRPGLFDGDDDETAEGAAAICRRCPALQACGARVDTLRHNQVNGVLAGQRREWISHPSEARKRGG